ncbi:MAG: hypothetical protein HFG49_12945 [Lachnospiraceae bacterium]|nr:hypothetical protein [Lachnospiraceae bacterium]
MDKFIFTYIDKDENGIFRDLTSDEAKGIIEYLPSHKIYSGGIMLQIEKAALSDRINRRVSVPFKRFFANLEQFNYLDENRYHILMPTTSIGKMSVSYLKKFKKKHSNVRLYAIVTDSIHAQSPHMDLVRDKLFSDVWDSVLTYDKYDAKEYHFNWFGYTYYSSFQDIEPAEIDSDIYYVGYNKGNREGLVNEIYQALIHGGVNCRFDVVSDSPNVNANSSLTYMREKFPYPEVVGKVKSSNCILEILQENQQAQSLRYFEAVVYNKKLLTTNPHIAELPFYNGKYMKCFSSMEEIDMAWIQQKEDIEYGYTGDFSPLHLVEYIEKQL